ncbi:hypothetical protein NL676_034195 [Syzygium grande]|nr:hypothetical protein NL676_034195 [Syzygium grande]
MSVRTGISVCLEGQDSIFSRQKEITSPIKIARARNRNPSQAVSPGGFWSRSRKSEAEGEEEEGGEGFG